MSKMYQLHSVLLPVIPGDREDLLNTLRSCGDHDCDFNGENGPDYNWEETTAGGFESNLDYLINRVSTIESDEECVNTFFDVWMGKDSNFYEEYIAQCLTDECCKVTAINFAVIY